MALGTPAACSDLPALLEVAREAALFFDPEDEAGMAATMLRLRKEEETREALVQKGRARAAAYAAIDVAGAYHELLGEAAVPH
jgi:glycosyltransferase involved in cell wall biosynthesis